MLKTYQGIKRMTSLTPEVNKREKDDWGIHQSRKRGKFIELKKGRRISNTIPWCSKIKIG